MRRLKANNTENKLGKKIVGDVLQCRDLYTSSLDLTG